MIKKIIFFHSNIFLYLNILIAKKNELFRCLTYNFNYFILKRILVDYKKLTPEILNLLVEKFPDGYGLRDIIHFTNHKGQYVDAVEVKTDDTIYLVKISEQLADSMENYEEEEDEDPVINDDLEIDVNDTDLEDDLDED